ncbi:receptor-activated Ca2+-permeable cation channel [Flagelloscypha sp. PMI_526]|nr:receptor-activated Ca2+-permeable cation channel [Flagelloscypha sp. PMI_526]
MDYETQSILAPTQEQLSRVAVYPLIASVRKQVTETIDSALTYDQLTASDVNFSIVRPLVFKFSRLRNLSVVYACLVCRSYFLSQVDEDLAFSGIMLSRASLCQILAMKLLASWSNNYIHLVAVLTTAWNPLAGAPSDVIHEVKFVMGGDDDDLNCPQSALEMAVSTDSKHFISSPITQRVIDDIYRGNVVFTTVTTRSMLADNYKPRAIEIYDARKNPFIDHYRLRVPRYGAILEFLNFAILLVTFLLCLSTRQLDYVGVWEAIFVVFAAAFTLEEYTASAEHGWIIYIANMWNVFDTSFVIIFLAYFGLRVKGLVSAEPGYSDIAFDILACGACILFPRLAFFAISNNVVVLSLRAMIADFCYFVVIAMVCFSGLLFTLWTLSADRPDSNWTLGKIAWLMVQIWFGNTYLSFAQAASFHEVFGPILMTVYAALSGTLLLTILISILSNTYAQIDANANQEYLFQFAISTIENIQSNALVSYQPPFNMLALLILKPLSYILTPRALHTANVFLIKLTHFPILLVIGAYERWLKEGNEWRNKSDKGKKIFFNSLPRHIRSMPFLEAFVGSTSADLYEAIFEVQDDGGLPDDSALFAEDDESMHENGGGRTLRSLASREGFGGARSSRSQSRDGTMTPPTPRRRRPTSLRSGRNRSVDIPRPLGSPIKRTISAQPHVSVSPADLSLLAAPGGPGVVGGGEISGGNNRSPLSKLFAFNSSSNNSNRTSGISAPGVSMDDLEGIMKRMEHVLEDVKKLPVGKLKEEVKDVQERQARIESLLMVLTRGMRSVPEGSAQVSPSAAGLPPTSGMKRGGSQHLLSGDGIGSLKREGSSRTEAGSSSSSPKPADVKRGGSAASKKGAAEEEVKKDETDATHG